MQDTFFTKNKAEQCNPPKCCTRSKRQLVNVVQEVRGVCMSRWAGHYSVLRLGFEWIEKRGEVTLSEGNMQNQ